MRCLKKTQSGAVCEIEVYSVPDGVKLTRNTESKPQNVRTDEEKARYNSHDHRFKRWFENSPKRAIIQARLKGGYRKPNTGNL